MNPEENQPQAGAAPAPNGAPASGATPSAPSENLSTTDQNDIANAINELANAAAAAGGAPAADAASTTTDATPAAEPASSTAPAPEMVAFDDLTADTTSSSMPTASPEPASPAEPTATAEPTSAPAPVAGTPAPDVAAAITELDADAVIDSIDAPETTPENSIPTAIGVDTTRKDTNLETPSASTESTAEAPFAAKDGDASEESKDGEEAKIISSEESEEEPIKPAEPVPGSIGSALKYSASAPDHSEPTEKPKGLAALFAKKPKNTAAPVAEPSQQPSSVVEEPAQEEPTQEKTDNEVPVSFGPAPNVPNPNAAKDKNKKNSTILALIIIGAVVLVGAIVAIIVFIMTSNDNKVTVTKTNPATTQPEPEDTSLICSYTSTANDIARAENNKLASYDLKMIANYTDDEMIDMSITGTYNYTDAEAASEGARQARVSYTRDYTKLNINSDPFTSNYPVSGNSFTASHFAKIDEIDENNASLLFLSAGSNGSVDTSKDAVREIFTKKGYTCRDAGGSQEAETEDEGGTTPAESESTSGTETTTGKDEEVINPDDEDISADEGRNERENTGEYDDNSY